MKKILLTLLLILSSATVMAVDFTVKGDNAPISLSQFRGEVVYLDFWASWCIPCRKSFPWMNQMVKDHAGKGFKIIAINLDKESALAKKFLTNNRADFIIGYDQEGIVAEQFNLIGMPSSYLIDREGNIVSKHVGFRDSLKNKMEAEIIAILAKGESQ